MNLEKIISVSGQPSLFRLVAARGNGLILEDLSSGKQSFFSSRINQFSPLDSIGIYTLADNVPLKEVYERFSSRPEDQPVPKPQDEEAAIKSFFEEVIPEYDRYRVHMKDMKKCLKWYHQLDALGLLKTSAE